MLKLLLGYEAVFLLQGGTMVWGGYLCYLAAALEMEGPVSLAFGQGIFLTLP